MQHDDAILLTEHMIDEILNVLSHAEDEGSSSSQENTPQHPTQHPPQPVIKQTLPVRTSNSNRQFEHQM